MAEIYIFFFLQFVGLLSVNNIVLSYCAREECSERLGCCAPTKLCHQSLFPIQSQLHRYTNKGIKQVPSGLKVLSRIFYLSLIQSFFQFKTLYKQRNKTSSFWIFGALGDFSLFYPIIALRCFLRVLLTNIKLCNHTLFPIQSQLHRYTNKGIKQVTSGWKVLPRIL